MIVGNNDQGGVVEFGSSEGVMDRDNVAVSNRRPPRADRSDGMLVLARYLMIFKHDYQSLIMLLV